MKTSTLIKTSTGIAFSLLIGSLPSSSALFFSSPALADISNIRQMNRNSNGSFNVTCLNGRTETVNAQAIAQNLVCQTDVHPRGIEIVEATYGHNCGGKTNNVISHIKSQCNGHSSCAYTINFQVIGDPAYGCEKDYQVKWKCGGDSTNRVYSAYVSPEAGFNKHINLTCSRW